MTAKFDHCVLKQKILLNYFALQLNEDSSLNNKHFKFIDLPIEVLDCSRTFYVCSIRELQ